MMMMMGDTRTTGREACFILSVQRIQEVYFSAAAASQPSGCQLISLSYVCTIQRVSELIIKQTDKSSP